MFELPEYTVLASQINRTLQGKIISEGSLGNSPHKFVWYNRSPKEFASLTCGKIIGKAAAKGRWLFIDLDPGYRLVFGECGGKIQYHAGMPMPSKYHLLLSFSDGSFLSAMTQMWGAMELYERGAELMRQYIVNMRPAPIEESFSYEYFDSLIRELIAGEKRSVKSLLTQDQLIPGLGNASAQDILFAAKLHPRHPIETLTKSEKQKLYRAILRTIQEITRKGGRNDEFDLFGNPGGYIRLMDKNAAGKPCPECKRKIEKIQYLGGACYFCPRCQPLDAT